MNHTAANGDADAITAEVARLLHESDGGRWEVELEQPASVGATRRTLFATAHRDGAPVPIVIQLAGLHLDGIAMSVESALVRLAADAGVPVAEPLVAAEAAETSLDVALTVSRHVEGVTVPRHVLRATEADPTLGPRLTDQCGQALADLHGLDLGTLGDDVPALVEPSVTEAYLAHLRAIATGLPASPVVALGLRWLATNPPGPSDRVGLVHGDFRNGNLIVTPSTESDTGGLAAIIDWELAHVGDPMEDLAWLCLRC